MDLTRRQQIHPLSIPSFPIATGASKGSDVGRRQEEIWVEDCRGEWYTGCQCRSLLGLSLNWVGTDRFHRKVTIGTLPDYVLLEIFNFYVDEGHRADIWHTLVHVCQRWRYLVFASPRRLNLQILCTNRRPVREMLDIWPALPIFVIWDDDDWHSDPRLLMDNILAALNHHERVRRIDLWQVRKFVWEGCGRAMQEPFPKLTELALRLNDEESEAWPFPDSFLGGTGPRLRSLDLDSVPFPALNKLLSSAKDLVTLRLWNIPHSGYISPTTMLTCLFAMPKLETLRLGFRSRPEGGETQRQPSLAREVLPSLTRLQFKGASEYLEDLISRIDAPLLDDLAVAFFDQPVFVIPRLFRFIDRTKNFKTFDEAGMVISKLSAEVTLHQRAGTVASSSHSSTRLRMEILCREPDSQLSSLAQACTTSLSPLSTVEHLEIFDHWQRRRFPYEGEHNAQWLAILRPFTAVKDLYVSEGFISHVPLALKDLTGERATEVLPALRNLYLRGLPCFGTVRIAVEAFVFARERSGHPVAFYRWEIDDASDKANCNDRF